MISIAVERRQSTEYRIPEKNENNLIFAVYQNTKTPDPI